MTNTFSSILPTACIAISIWSATGCVVETPVSSDEVAESLVSVAADGESSLKWNRIVWNRIVWNSIRWNDIDWPRLPPAKQLWHHLRANGVTRAPLSQADADPRLAKALVDPEVREILGYIVECALPSTAALTYEDASGTPWTFSGLHGLAPQWEDQSACDTSCQRTVSACLLARVNYHGERNVMSWRRASGIPYNEYTRGLEHPSRDENLSFALEEGAVWGNFFLETPSVHVCRGQDTVPSLSIPGVDASRYDGLVPMGAIRMCANDAECLRRVYAGPCAGAANPVCRERRGNGAYDRCQAPGGQEYTEVITIRRADFAIHADFVAGHALDPQLSSCAAKVGHTRPECLDDEYGPACVERSLDDCGQHSVRKPGAALSRNASTCAAYVCAIDGSCCTSSWDESCVEQAEYLCQ
jgi:hypothetical protein